jgi:hypothetical protein
MMLELHYYDQAAGFDDDGAPVKINHTTSLDLPPATPGRFAHLSTEERCQMFADLLASLADEGAES